MKDTLFEIHVLPRQTMTREEFLTKTPSGSIALDGMVLGGPFYNSATMHANFDHHDGVVREATMSTCMQVYFAIKGGLMQAFTEQEMKPHIWINDTDQDTSFAVWLLLNYKLFEGVQSIPHINRLLTLNDRWDVTAGAFPMNLSDILVRQHGWVFEPYSKLRKSGQLAVADEATLRENLDAVGWRLTQYLMGQQGAMELDTRHVILFDHPRFKIVDEIGGNEARYWLFNHGMNAYISLVARRADGRFVYTIGRRSQYIYFPVQKLYDAYNAAEGVTRERGFNGSDIVGGSNRASGSGLVWEKMRDITLDVLKVL